MTDHRASLTDTGPAESLLEVRGLEVQFGSGSDLVRVLRGVSFDLGTRDSLALVGESGSGKSVTARAVMGILRCPPGRIAGGQVLFRGSDLLRMPERQRRAVRGQGMTMVFQEALAALNPVLTVGYQIGEMFRVRQHCSRAEARRRTIETMARVHIPYPERRIRDYPHQFSGGMRQRVVIAMALALRPSLIIADEPTTALDVTVQAQVIELLQELLDSEGMSLIMITHDLGVASAAARRLAVMYAGRIVESGPLHAIFTAPAHPYTAGLMETIRGRSRIDKTLRSIKGVPPDLRDLPTGCPFAPRCERATDICRQAEPPLISVSESRASACHHWSDVLTATTTGVRS